MKHAQNFGEVRFFIPMAPNNTEVVYTTDEVSTYLRSFKLAVDPNNIDELVKRGIVGHRHRTGNGRSKSVTGRWSLPQRELLREALWLQQTQHAKVVDLCALPVSKWQYWGGPADIELEQIKRAMQTWTAYQYRRAQRSYERAEQDVRKLLQLIGHPDAVEKRAAVERLAKQVYNWQIPTEEAFQESFSPLIDPDNKGVARGPQAAPFSPEAISHLIAARMTAIEKIRKRQVPDALWEWARAFYLVTFAGYEQQRPGWAAEVSHDPRMASLYQENTLSGLCSAACHELTLVVGVGLLNPAPNFLPRFWHPETWLQQNISGQVITERVFSPLFGPDGRPIMRLHTRVSFDVPSTLCQP